MSISSRVRRLAVGLVGASVAAVAFTTTVPAPATALPLLPPNILSTLPPIPFDAELAGAVRLLKAAGVDQMALQAAQAVMGSAGQLSVEDVAGRAGALPLPASAPKKAATGDPLAILKALGVQTLTPSVSPFCTAPTADNPLGLVTAGAGAVAGPWPLKTDPVTPLKPLLDMLPGVEIPDFNLVDKGETAYAFVPATTTAKTGGKMQVAWFNTSTLQGGFADLKPVSATNPALTVLPMLDGVRLAPVKTGSGTVLSAVFGNVQNGTQNCWFLPAVGVVNA